MDAASPSFSGSPHAAPTRDLPRGDSDLLQHEFRIDAEMATPRTLTMRVIGELDADTADHLHETLAHWLGITGCVIDLSDCDFIDSRGISALLRCRLELPADAWIRLDAVPPNVEHTLRLAGLDTVFEIGTPAA
jgi:anti-anti-sigma factor